MPGDKEAGSRTIARLMHSPTSRAYLVRVFGDFFAQLFDFDADLAEEVKKLDQQIIHFSLVCQIVGHRFEDFDHRA